MIDNRIYTSNLSRTLMNKLFISIVLTIFTLLNITYSHAEEEPVQHLQLDDITSLENAKYVFFDTTSQIRSKSKFDATELNEIHIITYSLEKAVAYFAGNLSSEKQLMAKEMAETVELIHIASENNRTAETQAYVAQYLKMAESFTTDL